MYSIRVHADQNYTSQNSFLMTMITPAAIRTKPRQSIPFTQLLVPIISSPESTPITTETRVSCISFIMITTVTSTSAPLKTITAHCSSEGTTSLAAGKKMGKPMLQRKMNWCAIVQGLLSFSLKISEFTQPKSSPGRNSHSLLIEQLFSISSEPAMISPKKAPYMPIFDPLAAYQYMAKRMPPDPFHPKCMLSSRPVSEITQSILSLLSKLSTGRQGMSSCLRMIQVQLMMKAVSVVTNEYWIMGMAKSRAMPMWASARMGARMMRVSLEKGILGSLLNYLYSKSRGSDGGAAVVTLVSMLSLWTRGADNYLLMVTQNEQSTQCRSVNNRTYFISPCHHNLSQYHALIIASCIFGAISQQCYKIIRFRKNMRSNKRISQMQSHSIHKSRPSSILFRTILKPRNDQALPQSIDQVPLQKSRCSSKQSARKENVSMSRMKEGCEAGIREYVKQMKASKEEGVASVSDLQEKHNDMKLSRASSISKPTNSFAFRESTVQQQKTLSLEDLAKKVESLLNAKLEKLNLNKGGLGLSSWQFLKKENCLEPQWQEILDRLRSGEQSQQGIRELSARVEMLQRLLASETIESQLLKDRYFGFKNQRCNISSYRSKQLLATSSILNEKARINSRLFQSQQKAESLSNLISTNREAYSKPAKEYYARPVFKQPQYVPNRQVLPRSSYSTEFLHYGTMPTFNIQPLNSECLPSHVSLAVKASAYQQQFKQKYLSKPVDFRELDCYKNKFKNTDISFMNNCKKKMMDSVTAFKKTAKINEETLPPTSKLTKMLSHSTFSDFYKTQQRRNYMGHSASQTQLSGLLRAESKNGKLNDLKQALRAAYLRG